MVIFKHTFKKMLSLKSLLIYFIIFIPFFYLFISLFSFNLNEKTSSVNALIDTHLANFFIINFIWTLGIPFLISIISRGSALIQKEVEEDTLVLLVSKPIKRIRIYLEKWLASFGVSLVYGLLSISFSLFLYVLRFNLDSLITQFLIAMVPSFILYILFINLIFTSISLVLTAVINNRTKSVIVLVIFIMLFQLIFPIFKPLMIQSGFYFANYVYLFDINYQFGLLYYSIIQLFSGFRFTPFTQQQINQFIAIFDTKQGNIDVDLGFTPATYHATTYVNPLLLLLIWLLIALFFMYIAYVHLKKKDIG